MYGRPLKLGEYSMAAAPNAFTGIATKFNAYAVETLAR
jgi:hypothetical protein